jgi:osmotically-inducible protein OsmY
MEIEPGVIALSGKVRSNRERRRARSVLAGIKDVREIEDRLEVVRRRR